MRMRLPAVVLVLVMMAGDGSPHRQKRFLGADWWRQLQGRPEEPRPMERLGEGIGDLLDGLLGGLGNGHLFQHSVVDRRDGEQVVMGDHSLGLDNLENLAGLGAKMGLELGGLGAQLGTELGGLGAELGKDMAHNFGHFGSSSFSSSSSFSPSFSSSSSFSSSNLDRVGGMEDFDPFSMFGLVRKKWYQGEGICTEKEVVDEGEVEERDGFGIFRMNMRRTHCRDEAELHECRTEVTEGGLRRTIVERKVCCHGHRREPGTIGCTAVSLQAVEDTVRGLGGSEFIGLMEEHNLMDLLTKNVTVFLPSDDAVEDFLRDLQPLNQLDKSGVTERRRRRRSPLVLDPPALDTLLRGHLAPGFLPTAGMEDEAKLDTEDENGSQIRITVYNTFPQKVVMANCARISSADHMATNGMVHMVDRVLVPASKTIASLLETELDTSTFFTALERAGMSEKLDGDGQFTVFAPTEQAMEMLDPSTKERLADGEGCAGDILRNHILPNVVCSGIVEGRVKTNNLLSSMLLLSRSEAGEVSVEGARLTIRDVMATNGVVHLIDRVLVPEAAKSLGSALATRPRLLGLLRTADLMDHFSSLTNTTLFLPTEEVLAELPDSFVKQLEEEPDRMKEMLLQHVASPQLALAQLPVSRTLASHSPGRTIRIDSYRAAPLLGRAVVTAQCARLLHQEEVCGATIHSVDKVLLPPAGDILEVATNANSYSTFLGIVAAANLTSLLSGPDITLLAPTDEAMSALDVEVTTRLAEDQEFARETVERHLLREVLCCAGIHRNNLLFNTSRKRTASGGTVSVRRSTSGHLYADRAEISKCDMVATNGVVHQLDALMMPRRRAEAAEERRDQGLKNIFNFNPFSFF